MAARSKAESPMSVLRTDFFRAGFRVGRPEAEHQIDSVECAVRAQPEEEGGLESSYPPFSYQKFLGKKMEGRKIFGSRRERGEGDFAAWVSSGTEDFFAIALPPH